ncbi:hypothetical protein BWR59_22470 [Pseudomonas sp. Bc-h]|uniref:hypothetical protein n=1 Tax=Pseudomonas sp. Bc-h TaxID=1943632 RepID=UPI0009D92F74|nr:hypothetical protein [Pseudomonas sp. Bc-h]OQR29054.1 hypothetical protein BWR59_22470 [Pseudomonas sp. Bc-h]
MHVIDRYELTIPGHMRLVDARSALNDLERFVERSEGQLDRDLLGEKLELLVEALNDAADDTRPIDGHDAFMRQACEWNYIALSHREHEVLQELRSCSAEGQEDIFRMISDTLDRKPTRVPL